MIHIIRISILHYYIILDDSKLIFTSKYLINKTMFKF